MVWQVFSFERSCVKTDEKSLIGLLLNEKIFYFEIAIFFKIQNFQIAISAKALIKQITLVAT